ncbi:hypothetical protein H4219_005938 [Mycoemilia scoparia]|uniref:Aminoglycoside phosphotransferase domain-containing protein n=1 Tax=Mycoemilia scoparia TaxID=417184 RepID=A0A9W7ZLY8_9FUNG|nr:hypothetical protein H4219_005938 [Mycoemilia scoparia]
MAIYRKYGTLQEAQNLECVQDKVSCPRLINYYPELEGGDCRYCIEMEHIQGKKLTEIWPELNEQQQQIVAENIKAELKKLHSIPVDKSWIGNNIGQKRTAISDLVFGTIRFTNIEDFNNHIINIMPERSHKLEFLFRSTLPNDFDLCLCHGDLYSENIMVRSDLGIVFTDWGCLGCLPCFWDEMKLFASCPLKQTFPIHVISEEHFEYISIYSLIIMTIF